MVERILLPSALGDGEPPIEVPMLRRFDTQLGQAWQERVDQTDEVRLISIASELEEFFGDEEVYDPLKFYDLLRGATYTTDEGEERTALEDLEAAVREIRIDTTIDLYDLWWTKVYCQMYIEHQIEDHSKPEAVFKKIGRKLGMKAVEIQRKLRRDSIVFMKSLFLEWATASRKGEVEVMVMAKALGGSLHAAEMFRRGFNANRSGKQVVDVNHSGSVEWKPGELRTDELIEMIARERKLAGIPAALPMGEVDDDQESESEGTESERAGGGASQAPQDERDDP